MHKVLLYVAYGFLTFGGTMHLAIDVVSQYLRGKRAPGPETTLYYGLNTAFAVGQIVFGIAALIVARRAIELLDTWPMVALSLFAALAWLGFAFAFLEYKEPRFIVATYGVLVLAAAVTRGAS